MRNLITVAFAFWAVIPLHAENDAAVASLTVREILILNKIEVEAMVPAARTDSTSKPGVVIVTKSQTAEFAKDGQKRLLFLYIKSKPDTLGGALEISHIQGKSLRWMTSSELKAVMNAGVQGDHLSIKVRDIICLPPLTDMGYFHNRIQRTDDAKKTIRLSNGDIEKLDRDWPPREVLLPLGPTSTATK